MGKTILISSHILTELSDFCNTIGIIEQGKLLVAGPVDVITEQLRGAMVVEVRLKDDPARAQAALEGHAGVTKVEADGDLLSVHLGTDHEDPAALMEFLMQQGIKVASFREVEADLEDIFLKITKGAVQ